MMQTALSTALAKSYEICQENPLSQKLYQLISVVIVILLHVRNIYDFYKNCVTEGCVILRSVLSYAINYALNLGK